VSWLMLAQADVVGGGVPDLAPSLWRMLGAMAIVLGLLAGLAWLLRRNAAARRAGKGMGVESALSLGERRSLVVVTIEGRRLLLGLAPNAVSLVTELGPPASFEQVMEQATVAEAPHP